MADNNLNVMNDLGTIKSIDFVNKFQTNINDLLVMLGVTRKEPMTTDMQIKLYKWSTDMDTTATVGEGETIPLSKATRKLDRTVQVSWIKKRRLVSAEAVARHGASVAIDQADGKILREMQNDIKKTFVNNLGSTNNKFNGTDLQTIIAKSWGKLSMMSEFDGSSLVSFVNPLDVADLLAGKPVQADASNAYGMTLLQNFLGAERVVSLASIPQGKVYTTAVDNIVLAYLNMSSSELSAYFVDYVDETGLLAVARDRNISNLTLESIFTGAMELFVEIPDGVVEGTIGESTEKVPVNGVTMSQKTASMKVGDTKQVTASVAPENATNKKVTYSSEDEAIATIGTDGTITAIAEGTVNVVATSEDGGLTDKTSVTVSPV